MQVKVKKVSKRIDNRLKKAIEADKQWVEIGHFAEQGKHYSGRTYPELLAYWHRHPVFPKMILVATSLALKNFKIKGLRVARDEWIQHLNTDKMLNKLGMIIKEVELSFFGKVGPYMSPDADRTPLVETHDLEDKTTYKTSTGGLKNG